MKMLTREPVLYSKNHTEAVEELANCHCSECLYGQLMLLLLFAVAVLLRWLN